MATSLTGSTADANACSDNELVEVENHKNETRFKSADGNLYYVGGGRLAEAICLLPQYLFSVLYFILHAATPKIGASVQERLVVKDHDLLATKKQIAAILPSPEEEIKLEYANIQVCNIYVN